MDILFIGIGCIALILFFRGEKEYNYKDKDYVANYLSWGYLVGDGIIFNKNGSFQKTYKIRGKDKNSLEKIDLINLRAKINNALKRLDGNWSIHVEARRRKATPYIPSDYKSKILQKMDKIREGKYNSGEYFESECYLTFTWLPPTDNVKKITEKFIEDNGLREDNKLKFLKNFKSELSEYLAILKNSFNEIKELNDEETLTFLHSSFSQNENQNVKPLRKDVFLDAYLSDTPITDGLPPKIGNKYIGIIGILAYPTESFPAMFDEINNLGIELRWSSRFIFMNRKDSLTLAERVKGKWANKRKDSLTALEDRARKTDSGTTNFDAEARTAEATALLSNLQNEEVALGYYTFNIIIKDESVEKLDKKIEEVIAIIQKKGFTAIKESVNILQAFFGSMAGDLEHNVRQVPLPTTTAIDLMQFTSVWSGDKENKHFNAPALFFSNSTKGTSPTYFNLHVNGVGHTSIFGKTGGGKSVLLCFLAASFKKYKDSQVFFFDKGGSSRVLTTAVGGKFYDLGSSKVTFQPLSNIGVNEENLKISDKELEVIKEKSKNNEKIFEKLKEEKIIELKEKEEERANKEKDWAFEWLCEIFEQENIQLTPELKNRISEALNSIAAYEKERRTITQFQIQLQDNILRTAIKPYTKDGAFGRYFDSNNDSFTPEYSWQVFEMEKIMESKTACPPMLKYIFHKLEVEMFADGKPTILILDECWSFLSNKSFAEKIKEWLKVLRKKNVSVVFATQELTDVLNSEIKDSLLNSCPSTIYLANSKATTSNYRKIYNSLGLNDTQILNIANLEERRDYYLVSTVGNLDFRPAFSQFELAFIGASSIEDQNKCIEIEAELRKNDISKEVFEEEFYKRWKEYKGLEEEI